MSLLTKTKETNITFFLMDTWENYPLNYPFFFFLIGILGSGVI